MKTTASKKNIVSLNRDQDRTVLAVVIRTLLICLFGYGFIYMVIQCVKNLCN